MAFDEKGAGVMVPVAIPDFGRMIIERMTLWFVPVTCSLVRALEAEVG